MSVELVAIIVTVIFGALANIGALIAFRVSMEHRITKLETRWDAWHGARSEEHHH